MAAMIILFPSLVRSATAEASEPLSGQQFLREVRRPFRSDAWGRLSGSIATKGDLKHRNEPLSLALRFSPHGMAAQLVLGAVNCYRISQAYSAAVPDVRVERPEHEDALDLTDFGVKPEDFTFSFLYWNVDEELPGQRLRGQSCRVLRLVHPRSGEVAVGWFSDKYFFPLKVCWYEADGEEPSRQLEFTDFRKQPGGFWFTKHVRLSGKGWKTRIRFEEVEVFNREDRPVPSDLFDSGVDAR